MVEKFLGACPVSPLPEINGLSSGLRNYQRHGTEWLWYLLENGFGGLLCDDMGLGKTHQVMALLLCMRNGTDSSGPFLVVCPTTVLSHWDNKIREFAPDLAAAVYHGGDRNLSETLDACHVVLTSYGILLRDITALKKVPFALAVSMKYNISKIRRPRLTVRPPASWRRLKSG